MQTRALKTRLKTRFFHDNAHFSGDNMSKFQVSFLPPFLPAIVILFSLAACTTADPSDTRHTGPEFEYSQYTKLVQESASLELLADQWSRSAKKMLYGTLDNSGQPIALDNFQPVLMYPTLFSSPPTAPLSESDEKQGCLMVFGKASDGGMLALHIKFIFEDGRWLHEEVHAQYLDNDATPPTRPNCQFPSPPL